MAPQVSRALTLVTLAAALWTLYLLPWPGPGWVAITKPTVTAVAFAVLSSRLRVGSWPLTIVFCLTFFVHGVVDVYARSIGPGGDLAGEPPGTRHAMLYLWAMLFSPISLWAPVLFGALAYALVARLRSNKTLEGP